MKVMAACLEGPRRVSFKERELRLGDEQVLVRTHQASICGTDKNLFVGRRPPELETPYLETFGHEGGGIVEAVGPKVTRFEPGDRVMSFGLGTFASHFVADQINLAPAPDGLDMDLACLGEPIGCAMYCGFKSGVELGDTVAIVGMGFAGQIVAQIAKRKGAQRVIGIDVSKEQLDLGLRLGLDVALNPKEDDVVAAVRDLTGGHGADVAVDAAGNEASLTTTTDVLRFNGIFVLYSWPMESVTININRWHDDAFDIRSTAFVHINPPHERDIWLERLLKPVASGMIDVRSLITHRFRLEELDRALIEAVDNPAANKVALSP